MVRPDAPELRPHEPPRDAGLLRLSAATVGAMFPLIWFGGLTTSHGAGLAVPDWPNTYGYNMFAAPWGLWLGERAGGVFFEHTHRLLGSLVGFLALATCLRAWGVARRPGVRKTLGVSAVVLIALAIAGYVGMRLTDEAMAKRLGHAVSGFGGLGAVALVGFFAQRRQPRLWVRWLATALLLAVCLQGLLGGLRVTEVNLSLAIVHGIFAQMTLCLAGTLVLVNTAWWHDTRPAATANAPRVAVASTTLTLLILGQLVIAALMRHNGAGLAVPDFPLSYGQIVPPTTADGLQRANVLRLTTYGLDATTLPAVWLHTAHRVGALLVTLGAAWVVREMFHVEHPRRPTRHARLLVALLLVQIGLGVATVWMQKPADVATAHVAVGATLLLTSHLLTARLCRLYGWRPWRVLAPRAKPTPELIAVPV